MPLANPADPAVQAVFLYGRNSTDDQAEAGTIKNQQDFLRNFAALYGLNVVGEHWDEGVSGTVPLDQRPDGRRLVEAIRTRPGAAVLVYRLDRLGRTLRTLLEAHDALEGAGVTIRSATEPFDTGTPIEKFLFQRLASLAELERSTIAERMALGKSRVAKAGKWVGGPIPFGYDVDEAATMLAALAQEVDEIEETNDLVRKRRVIEMLVAGIRVKPQGRGIDGRVSVTYRFGRPHAPVISLTNAKNARLRSVVSPQLTGTSW